MNGTVAGKKAPIQESAPTPTDYAKPFFAHEGVGYARETRDQACSRDVCSDRGNVIPAIKGIRIVGHTPRI